MSVLLKENPAAEDDATRVPSTEFHQRYWQCCWTAYLSERLYLCGLLLRVRVNGLNHGSWLRHCEHGSGGRHLRRSLAGDKYGESTNECAYKPPIKGNLPWILV